MTVNFHAQSLPGCLVPHRSRTLSVPFWSAILIGKKNFMISFYCILTYMVKIQATVSSWMGKVCHGNIFIFLHYCCILCYFTSHACVSMYVCDEHTWKWLWMMYDDSWIFCRIYFFSCVTLSGLWPCITSYPKKGEVLVTHHLETYHNSLLWKISQKYSELTDIPRSDGS